MAVASSDISRPFRPAPPPVPSSASERRGQTAEARGRRLIGRQDAVRPPRGGAINGQVRADAPGDLGREPEPATPTGVAAADVIARPSARGWEIASDSRSRYPNRPRQTPAPSRRRTPAAPGWRVLSGAARSTIQIRPGEQRPSLGDQRDEGLGSPATAHPSATNGSTTLPHDTRRAPVPTVAHGPLARAGRAGRADERSGSSDQGDVGSILSG